MDSDSQSRESEFPIIYGSHKMQQFFVEFLGMAVEEHMAAVLKGIALFIGSIDGIFWIPFGDYVFDVGSHLSVSPEKQYYCQKGRRTWNQ